MEIRMNSVEIITIGDEILVGQTVDTNSAWMGKKLNDIGWDVVQITSVSDNASAIKDALRLAAGRADVILMTGGLGPTKDDITKKTLAEYFNTGWRTDEKVLEHIKAIFVRRNMPLLDVNLMQAEVPESCRTLFNDHGTAPAMLFEEQGKVYISMPGVPNEMMHVMKTHVLPFLSERNEDHHIIKHTYLTSGIGESFLSKKIAPLEEILPEDISLAYLPYYSTVKLRFTAKGSDRDMLENNLRSIREKLFALAGDHIIYEGDKKLEEIIAELLIERNATLTFAESCTGGLLSHLITSIPGSSAYFKGSIISYSNEVKTDQLQVSENILNSVGAVSKETVEQMANAVRENLKSDYSVATSGIAGPGGGTAEKPVGTVWIAVASRDRVWSHKALFTGSRQVIMERTAITALDMLRKLILGRP